MKIKFFLTVLLMFACLVSRVWASEDIPAFLNYQGTLTDEGGNLLPDGNSSIKFQILDSIGGVLYEEIQDVEIVEGKVSAIIGNGLDLLSRVPMGGVPPSVFDPKEARYLGVEADGVKAYDPMEIVSTPYSVWSNFALGLADGALTSGMIGEKVVKVEHLSDELLQKFTDMIADDAVSQTGFVEFKSTLQESSGAGMVGVIGEFNYSDSNTVQGVVSDLDAAVKNRKDELDAHSLSTTTHGVAGAIVGTANSQTLSNKTYQGTLSNTIGNHSGTWQGFSPTSTPTAKDQVVVTNSNGFLTTPQKDPASNYEVANKKYVDGKTRSESVYRATSVWYVTQGTATRYAVAMFGFSGKLNEHGDVEVYIDKNLKIVGSNIWLNGDVIWWEPGDYRPSSNGEWRYNSDTGRLAWFSDDNLEANRNYNILVYYLVTI